MENWLTGFNVFNIAATAAGVWMFIQSWWILIALAILYLVSRNKGDKKDKGIPKHLPTKEGVIQMLSDLYLK